MRIISWNVNGLRAVHRKGAWDWLLQESPKVFCLQEIKAEAEQLSEDVRAPEGYHAYFNSSRERKGYSGVALYSKTKPDKVETDVLPDSFNTQGRLLEAHFGDLVLFNLYMPNGGRNQERLEYKLGFFDAFLVHIEKLKKSGKQILFFGDINVAHEPIDLARPKENQKSTGFLPEERAWLDEVIAHGYVDVWREQNPEKPDVYTYWDMVTRARERNVGWRIDYFFADQTLLPKLKAMHIHTSVLGSDHCPISLSLQT